MINRMLEPIKPFYRKLRHAKNLFIYGLNNIYLANAQRVFIKKRFVPESEDLIECFQLPKDILDKVVITSFYNSNISATVVRYQKKIFDLFKLPIVQVEGNKTHAEFLSETLLKSGKQFVLFFDIDAIPLQKEAVFLALKDLEQGFTITAALQTASHIKDGKNNYAGPFFMGIETQFYKQCGAPSLHYSEEFDVAAILTYHALKLSKQVKYWVPTHVEVRKWPLYRVGYFGLGTTYNGLIYHAFEGREGNSFHFISKCKKVLKKFENS